MSLTRKHANFIDEYFLCNMNPTQAYLKVYPDSSLESARYNSSRLINSDKVREEINRRLTEKHMSADEVLSRLADMARSDIATFAKVDDPWQLQDEDYKGKTHVIRKFKKNVSRTKDGTEYTNVELELYDAQSALVTIGKQHGLFSDRRIIETRVEKELDSILEVLENELGPDDFNRIVTRLTSGAASSPEVETEDSK